jgi:phosphoribosylformylglycinamidine (FGAM) synthase PurS component
VKLLLASISGKVLDADGKPIAKANVSITDPRGVTRTVTTKGSGAYLITDVPVGKIYILEASHKKYTFQSIVVNVKDDLSDQDFVATNPSRK